MERERNITVEEIREQIAARIERGWNDSNPEKQAQWRKIPYEGDRPTPEEWLEYAVKRLEAEGQSDLLQRHPYL